MVVSFRLSQWKQLDYAARIASTPAELAQIVAPLASVGVDIFRCSTRRYWEPTFAGSDLGPAAWVRRLSGRPTIAVGSITLGNDFKSEHGKQQVAVAPEQLDDLERRLQAGEFDLVAVGRALLGHMVEVYWPSPSLDALYRDVAAAAANWDGRQLKLEVDPAK